MDVDKDVIKATAEYAEKQAEESLERAMQWANRSGAQAGLGDLVSAGSLFSVAAELRKRLK